MSIPILNPSLQVAVDTGGISEGTAQALSNASAPSTLDLGVKAEDIRTPKVTLVAVLLDDSGSMSSKKSLVLDALNDRLIAPLRGQQSRNEILLAITSLWHGVLVPFTKVSELEAFDETKFQPGGGTPFRRSVKDTSRLLVEKQAELALSSITARIFFLAYTDGEETEHNVDLKELCSTIQELDSKKANFLQGVACGSAAKQELGNIGFKRIADANDALALEEAFSQFSRATSAAAAE